MNRKIVDAKSSIYSILVGKFELVFMVTNLPNMPGQEDRGIPGLFTGYYVSVTLLNGTMKCYIIGYDPGPLGYEYIMEKFDLNEEFASALTMAICNLIGRECSVPEKYEAKYRFALNRLRRIM